MQTLFSLLLILLFFIPLAQPKPSLKQPVHCKQLSKQELIDCHVRHIANFAVTEYNKNAGTHLKLLDIFDGCSQIVAGKNYYLTLGAINGGNLQYCNAVVYENLSNDLRLTSFELLPKPENGFVLLPINQFLVNLAKFAIAEINKQSNEKFIFGKLDAALYEGLIGGDDVLYILAYGLPNSGINRYYFRARVNDDAGEPFLRSYDSLCITTNKFIGMVTDTLESL